LTRHRSTNPIAYPRSAARLRFTLFPPTATPRASPIFSLPVFYDGSEHFHKSIGGVFRHNINRFFRFKFVVLPFSVAPPLNNPRGNALAVIRQSGKDLVALQSSDC